ncbi:hypothetical protein CN617_31765, partial [Bacillus wiedmannii]
TIIISYKLLTKPTGKIPVFLKLKWFKSQEGTFGCLFLWRISLKTKNKRTSINEVQKIYYFKLPS